MSDLVELKNMLIETTADRDQWRNLAGKAVGNLAEHEQKLRDLVEAIDDREQGYDMLDYDLALAAARKLLSDA